MEGVLGVELPFGMRTKSSLLIVDDLMMACWPGEASSTKLSSSKLPLA